MAPRTKKLCTTKVRDGSKRVACKVELRSGEYGAYYCPNRAKHISPLKTGFCAAGACEGSKKKSYRGTPLKTCSFWETCACTCHDIISAMFESTGLARIVMDNPEYIPPKVEHTLFIIPDVPDSTAPFIPNGAVIPPGLEDAAMASFPAVIAPATERQFAPTRSGRSARGELEQQVKKVCDCWLLGDIDNRYNLTNLLISMTIATDEGIKPPSTGAVNAVLLRWETMGFAVLGRKPTRFISYTKDGLRYGLDGMKLRMKQGKRLASATQSRSLRR